MKTKKQIKNWLENQIEFSKLSKDHIDMMTNDVQKALKTNPKRTEFTFNIAHIQIPSYQGLNPE